MLLYSANNVVSKATKTIDFNQLEQLVALDHFSYLPTMNKQYTPQYAHNITHRTLHNISTWIFAVKRDALENKIASQTGFDYTPGK